MDSAFLKRFTAEATGCRKKLYSYTIEKVKSDAEDQVKQINVRKQDRRLNEFATFAQVCSALSALKLLAVTGYSLLTE